MKSTRLSYLLLTCIAILLFNTHSVTAQQLFRNGDFNATTSYYTTACTSVEATYYETTYGGSVSTNHVAEVDDEACMYQDVCILPGASYTFSMDASRRTSGSPNPLTTHIKITGLDAGSSVVATYVDMDFTRTNTTFALTPVTGIPTINVASGSGVVKLRVLLTDNTTGYSMLGMIVDNLSLTFATPPAIVGADTICLSSSQVFSVSGVGATGITYLWNFGAGATPGSSTIANPSVTWASTGTKTVTAVLGNGVCYVDTINYTFEVRGAVAVHKYDSICSDATYPFGGATLHASGTYTDSFTTAGGCDSIITLHLYVKQVPNLPAISGDTVYCVGQAFIPFTVIGAGTTLWYPTATGGVGTTTPPSVSTGSAGSYTFYAAQNNMGCEGPRSTVTVSVYENSVADFTYDIHYGCARDTVVFTNNSLYASSYTWSFGDGVLSDIHNPNPVHFYNPVTTSTDFFVKVVAHNTKCFEDSTVQRITLTPMVFPRFLTGVTTNQTIVHGSSVQLNASGAVYYYWSPNDGKMTNPNINNPIVTPDDSTKYTLYGYDGQGCLDSAFVTIKVLYNDTSFIPSGFTPNNDGRNDVFRITHHRFTKLVDFSVYNRWGQLVFQTADITKGWDGTWNNTPQDIGVYKYIIITSSADGTNLSYTGDITLIR